MERERNDASRRRREERKWERERGDRDRSTSQDSGYDQSYHSDDDRKPAALPTSVAVDDNRSQNSESGYHSSEALSDGYLNQAMEHNSSLQSAESVGSHGSGSGFRQPYQGTSFRDALHAGSIMNGEARFPFAMSYPYSGTEVAKSDIATVCSGSVTEDIDLASVLSGGEGSLTTGTIMPSPSAERVGASIVMVGGGNFRRQGIGGRVEFAADSFGLPPPRLTADHLSNEHASRSSPRHSSDTQTLAMMNDMGPPLSRALLDQSNIGEPRAESVRSFGSNTGKSDNSDVAAQVDTDDCGGSLNESVTDGHSIHSQEDVRIDSDEKVTKKDDSEPHPLLRDGISKEHPNGRTSPGGTIYKGRGVRRYRGRYMNLPLKRFHQNGVTLGDDALDPDADDYNYSEGYDNRRYSPSPPHPMGYHRRSPDGRNVFNHGSARNCRSTFQRNSHSPEGDNDAFSPRHSSFQANAANNSPPDRSYGYAHRRRSRSRSRSRSASPRQSHSRSPIDNISGRHWSRCRETPSNSKPRRSQRRSGRDRNAPSQETQRSSPSHYRNRRRHNNRNHSGNGKSK